MAREADEARFYAVTGADGIPRVMHAIVGLQPDHAVEITEAQAREISMLVHVEAEPGQPQALAGAPVDLKPVLEKLAALAQIVADHASLHDETIRTVASHASRFDEHAKAIENVKVTTAKAIAQSLEGIGEKPA